MLTDRMLMNDELELHPIDDQSQRTSELLQASADPTPLKDDLANDDGPLADLFATP